MSLVLPKAVLFDLDGTLADSAQDLAAAVNKLLQQQGKPALPFDIIRPVVSKGTPGMLKVAFDISVTDSEFEPLKKEFLNIYNQDICSKTELFQFIPKLLLLLDENKIKWGIVTNKPEFLTEQLVPKLPFPSEPQIVISGDTFSEKKPHPLPLLEAAKAIGVEPENCWYVGDDERDMEAATAAGMVAIAALWGYIPTDDNPAQWPFDYKFSYPKDLLKTLQQLT